MPRIKALSTMLVTTLAAIHSHATTQVSGTVQFNCSESLSITDSGSSQWRCVGDLSIFGTGGAGTIDSDQALDIWASGSLSLQDMILSAPSITLTAGTLLNVGQGVQLVGRDIHLGTPTIGTAPPREVIDWATLDIQPGTALVNLSPAGSAVSVSGTRSTHAGALQAVGGEVVLVNTNGVQLAAGSEPAVLRVSSVPEPASGALSLLGLTVGGWLLRRRQRG